MHIEYMHGAQFIRRVTQPNGGRRIGIYNLSLRIAHHNNIINGFDECLEIFLTRDQGNLWIPAICDIQPHTHDMQKIPPLIETRGLDNLHQVSTAP